ncbi:hypothetical protein K469DRAFT_686592 [Zopfia rhizophila CBS 207.26]|uniref:Uncharacterized protein n=1 Tax=Zopfia rhizophila CBS 207.26 TaxID=1314779 RepID=A0A6A6EUA3_9PEZI|nr:hypothetical protein K469DRAFT_686592 [Zopfia rhizophila CBS 207.26]
MDYALASWPVHLRRLLQNPRIAHHTTCEKLRRSIRSFFHQHPVAISQQLCRDKSTASMLQPFKKEDYFEQLVQAMTVADTTDYNAQIMDHAEEIDRPLGLIIHLIRSVIDISRDMRDRTLASSLVCPAYVIGFTTAEQLKKHEMDYHSQIPDYAFTDSGYASTEQHSKSTGGTFENDLDDIVTTALDGQDLDIPLSAREDYIHNFAYNLYQRVSLENIDDGAHENVARMLPEMLRTFAIKLNAAGSHGLVRDAMVFVRHYRRYIAMAFKDIRSERTCSNSPDDFGQSLCDSTLDQTEPSDQDIILNDYKVLGAADKIQNWHVCAPDQDINDPGFLEEEGRDTETIDTTDFAVYRDTLVRTDAYQWLVTKIQRAILLDHSLPDIMRSIRDTVISGFPGCSPKRDRYSTVSCTAIFEVDWDPFLFFQGEGYEDLIDRALEKAICEPGLYDRQADHEAVYRITFLTEVIRMDATAENGECWRNLFRNPAIVRGFPILSRIESDTGVEIPLSIMAGLAEANRVTTFDGQFFVKGFSTMLVPTKVSSGQKLVFWHMLHDEDGSRIPYITECLSSIPSIPSHSIDESFLAIARHVVGTADACYRTSWTNLDPAGPGCAFDKVTISGGKIINIYFARSRYVVFYDTGDHRAWLINGADAMLRMVRASLDYARTELHEEGDDFLFKAGDLQEAESAVKVLKNRHNMDLAIYRCEDETWDEETTDAAGNTTKVTKRKETKVRFQDRVKDMYNVLEQIYDHQAKLSGPGMPLKTTPRQKLEGFDLMHIIVGEHPVIPRMTELKPSGRGWVDFSRSIQAITLFGCGFGDLIEPVQGPKMPCKHWITVPKGQDFLAAHVSDLREMMKRKGDVAATPMKLADGIYWHKAGKLFEPCECERQPLKRALGPLRWPTKCDRVQVLLPPSLGHKKHPGSLESNGAVIFGRSERYKWIFPERGHPKPGNEEGEELAAPEDSGLGSSIGSSTPGSSSSIGASSFLIITLLPRRRHRRLNASEYGDNNSDGNNGPAVVREMQKCHGKVLDEHSYHIKDEMRIAICNE